MTNLVSAVPTTSGQALENPTIPNRYKSSNIIQDISIDDALDNMHFFRISSFNFNIGDCLFDTIQVLLHCRYTCAELRNGLVDYFLHSLHHGSDVASSSFSNELHPSLLYDLHKVADQVTYLRRMRLSATETNSLGESGLWGDTFCIHWLSLWLDTPICIWSLTRKKPYLYFNKDVPHPTISILFHDINPLAGHYEPIFSRVSIYNRIQTMEQQMLLLSSPKPTISNIIEEELARIGLK